MPLASDLGARDWVIRSQNLSKADAEFEGHARHCREPSSTRAHGGPRALRPGGFLVFRAGKNLPISKRNSRERLFFALTPCLG